MLLQRKAHFTVQLLLISWESAPGSVSAFKNNLSSVVQENPFSPPGHTILINSLFPFFPYHGWLCFLPMVASAFQQFTSQLQHLHPSNRGFYSNKELMPLEVGFSTQLFCTCESKQMLQKHWLCPSLGTLHRVQTSAMSTAVFHGDTRPGLHFPAEGNQWFHITWQDRGFVLVEEQRAITS